MKQTSNKYNRRVKCSPYLEKKYKRHNKNKVNNSIIKNTHYISDDECSEGNESENDICGRLDIYTKNNHIYFKSGINMESATILLNLLRKKNDEYTKLSQNKSIKSIDLHPIYLHITSCGGDLFASFMIADAIQSSKYPIYTVIDGFAASGGTIMSVVGKKRLMTKHSYALIHQINQTMFGNYKFNEIKDDHDNLNRMMNDIKNLYLANTSLTDKQLTEIFKHDSYQGFDYCLKHGIVDGLYPEEETAD